MRTRRTTFRTAAIAAALLLGAWPAEPYSVLSHEAVVDTLWDSGFRPAILARFPGTTPEEMLKTHAFAYGGCIIQDMGYYPFGSKFFSDLTHYVRAGDFVAALLRDASNANEYAFALGALAHYASDTEGHPLATNRTVPLAYPKLRKKYGARVTYEDDPLAHLRTEFAFDVVQVAHHHYAPSDYHDFIGFEVSKDLLARAFLETYSLDLTKVFSNVDLALGTYRWTVRSLIPSMTKAAWAANKSQIVHSGSGITKRRFLYHLKRASFEKEWGRDYERPGLGERFLAFLLRFIPKIGPFRALAMPKLTAQDQELFMQSFNAAVAKSQVLLRDIRRGDQGFPNSNFDTGDPSTPGSYTLADQTYLKLIDTLASGHFVGISPELRDNLLAYCKDPSLLKLDQPPQQIRLQAEIEELRSMPVSSLHSSTY